MEHELMLTVAADDDLNQLVAGRQAGASDWWQAQRSALRLAAGSTGVLWRTASRNSDVVRPLVLVARDEDQKRLFARFAQLRSDLSPLTAWCHFAGPRTFDAFDGPTREVDLKGYEASWTGLIVAEAHLLAGRPVSKLRLPACLATQSFAVARSYGLWGASSVRDALDRFDGAQRLFRSGEARVTRLRAALEPIWGSLIAAGSPGLPNDARLRPLVEALRTLNEARSSRDLDEARLLGQRLEEVLPEAEALRGFQVLSPEQRLAVFDLTVKAFASTSTADDMLRRACLAFMAGYIATVAAGGAPTLSLAEAQAQRSPEISLWAYVLGGVGERVLWTSSFDGLGRLVARELQRPFRADEPPTCDIGLEEAQALVDNQLADPFVHLRLKQSRIFTVAILPGVNIPIAATDGSSDQSASRTDTSPRDLPLATPRGGRSDPELLATLANALWPLIERRVEAMVSENLAQRESKARGRQRGGGTQGGLPLKGGNK